jgi:hypothetical protein
VAAAPFQHYPYVYISLPIMKNGSTLPRLKTIITCFGMKMSHAEHAKAKNLLIAYVYEQKIY